MSPSCTLVVCAAPLANRWPEIAAGLSGAGFTVTVVLTDNARAWDIPKPPAGRNDPRRADAWVVAPLTFNSVAKMALGIADTYAHGLLCEAVGRGAQMTAVPMINAELFGHPALAGHLRRLKDNGVAFLDPQTGTDVVEPILSGTGSDLAHEFHVNHLVEAVMSRAGASMLRTSDRPTD